MKKLGCPDDDCFKLTWDIGSNTDILKNMNCIRLYIHTATKHILSFQE
jgi:hypothetical protein